MKNKRIIDSWNKIEPDSVAEARMLDAILTRKNSGQSEKKKELIMNKTLNWKRLAPIVACFVLVISLFGVVVNDAGWFVKNVYTVEVDGSMISFYKADVIGLASVDVDLDVTSRDLTAEENRILFGDLYATAYGMFNSENQALLHVEGRIGATKVLLAVPGLSVTDTVFDADKEVSEINDVPISAGYFVTKASSQGIKNIIYFASLTLGNVSVYVELGGEETNSEPLRNEIASIIEQLIQNGAPDMSRITK